jgi:hypothetical protein
VYPPIMRSDVWVFLAIAFVLVAGGVAYGLARKGRALAAWIWCGVLALTGVGLLFAARSAPGWDGLGYLLMLLMFAGPSFLGAIVGALVGIWVARRAKARAAPSD